MGKLTVAASSGNRRKALEELRDLLARELERAPVDCVASLALRLTDVLKQLDALAAPKGASKHDEIAARRAARRGAG